MDVQATFIIDSWEGVAEKAKAYNKMYLWLVGEEEPGMSEIWKWPQ